MSGYIERSGSKSGSITLRKDTVKAWVNFNGTTDTGASTALTVRDSFNVSSVIWHATGDYTINFLHLMANDDYCVAGFVGGAALNLLGGRGATDQENYMPTGWVRIGVRDASAEGWVDSSVVTLIIIGD